jgi:hypothetical protein
MVTPRRGVPHSISQVIKFMKWLIISMSSLVSRKELQRIMKKMTCGRSSRFFGSYHIGKTLNIHHSIDVHVVHIEKNVCKSLIGTLLNMNEKTRDHRHARADMRKMVIRQELRLDDFVKGMELSTSCITLSKNEKK